jgi:uncharacterized tellurite resistance protein B-like protein
MSDERLIMALAKVLVAAAWVDGEPSHEEINSMKDLLFRLPQLSSRQWAELEIYVEAPVDEAERARLVEDLQHAIRSPQDRDLAIRTLDELMMADGELTEEEEMVAAGIKAAIDSVDLGPLSRLVKGMTGRRSRAVANAPNREDYLDEFLRNKVYYGVRRRLDLGEAALDFPDEVLRTLSLAGGMMAQIARVNPEVTDGEFAAMVDALQEYWHLTAEQATWVVEVAVSETASLMDRHRLAREFAEACSPEERGQFLDVLFAVAAADGQASYEEIEELRQIARSLKLSHQDFIDAKLRVPSDQRAQ